MIDKGIFTDNHPIKIRELEKVISKMKKSGCNYISIDYNCDHPDYTFCGIDAHQATDEEVKEEIEKDKNKKLYAAQERLKNLEKNRNTILEEIEKIKNDV